jgi:hypothetical protein
VRANPQPGRLAFTTNGGFTPGTGIATADALCQSEANAAGRTGTFMALLATAGATAASRYNLSGLPWKRVDEVTIVDTASQLPTGPLRAINVLLNGDGAATSPWAGAGDLNTAGTMASTCDNWNSTAGTGTSTFADNLNNVALSTSCNVGLRIRCLQQ